MKSWCELRKCMTAPMKLGKDMEMVGIADDAKQQREATSCTGKIR
jgi:hypothetical protein